MTPSKPSPSRKPTKRYDDLQSLMMGFWIFDIWNGAGFASAFEGDGRRFMPRLLIGSCLAEMKQRPISITEAFVVMDTKHGRTAAKYISEAEKLGLITKRRDPDGDKRKEYLLPTELLKTKFQEEMARTADDMRELFKSLVQRGLPETGHPDFMLKSQDNEDTRHNVRAEGPAHMPSRPEAVRLHS